MPGDGGPVERVIPSAGVTRSQESQKGGLFPTVVKVGLTSTLRHGSHGVVEPTSKNGILLLKFLVSLQSCHQFGAGFVCGSQLGDAPFQVFNVLFGSLTDCSLSFSVICTLSLKLCRSECGDASCASPRRSPFGSGLGLGPSFRARGEGLFRRRRRRVESRNEWGGRNWKRRSRVGHDVVIAKWIEGVNGKIW